MAFCDNCGEQVNDGTKFCASCGAPTDSSRHTNNSKRKTVYEGEIHKCPQCGEVIDSFVTICTACGYELRGSTTSAVKEFAAKLDNVATGYQKEILSVVFLFQTQKRIFLSL